MLTPQFTLSQTEQHVEVTISVPTVRVTNIEVLLDDDKSTFHFYASPYLLRLHFAPHQFLDDENVESSYDPSLQQVNVKLTKETPCHWPNLDLTARLIQPREVPSRWLHAVTDDDDETATVAEDDVDVSPDSNLQALLGYGFGDLFQNIFTDY